MVTPSQFTLLEAIINSDYHDGQPVIGNHVWAFSATDALPEASRGGVVAKALEAGLIEHNQEWDRINGKKVDASTIAITQLGWDIFTAEKASRKEMEKDADLDRKLATKAIKLADRCVSMTIWANGEVVVGWADGAVSGKSALEAKKEAAKHFHGRQLAIISKWITVLSR